MGACCATTSKDEQEAIAGTGAAVIVEVVVKKDRVNDFLVAMEDDVTKSRQKELDPGCVRFDLLQDRETPNRFFFYEAYLDDEAAAAHKKTAHYKSWADFKASGGVEKQEVTRVATSTIPGGWAFQARPTIGGPVGSAVLVTVEIKEDRIDDFLTAMYEDVTNSRITEKDPRCARFDLLRNRDQPNKFVFYEAFKDDSAATFHKTTNHYNSWAQFKKSGGVISQSAVKVATSGIQGSWAFDPRTCRECWQQS